MGASPQIDLEKQLYSQTVIVSLRLPFGKGKKFGKRFGINVTNSVLGAGQLTVMRKSRPELRIRGRPDSNQSVVTFKNGGHGKQI